MSRTVLAVVLTLSTSAIADDPIKLASNEAIVPPPSADARQPSPAEAPAKVVDPAPEPPLALKPVSIIDERLVLAPGKGITAKTADGNFSLTVRARMQVRDTFVHERLDTNELGIKTLRLYVQGNVLSPDLKYLVQLAMGTGDFEAGNPSPIFDAFVEYTKWRDLNVRVGQFFVPFDRARTVRESSLQLVDRQIAVRELTLDRDVGVMLSSQDLFGLNRVLAYNFFVGGGDGRNRVGAQMAGPLVVLRLAVRPFGSFDDDSEGDLQRESKPRLSIGVAGAYNIHTTRAQSTFGSVYTNGTFDYAHAALDVTFKWGGFSLLAEGVVRKADADVRAGATPEYSRSGWGYFVQAGYMVSRLVEVTARWDQLYAFQNTDPALITLAATQGRQLGGGVNIYLNGHALKIQADYFYIWGHSSSPARHSARIALDASF